MARTSSREARPAGILWREIRDWDPSSGAWNMAVDHALAEANAVDGGVVRFYRWAPHTVSFGRNEPAVSRYDRKAGEALGLGFVRRPTGGRAVLHAHEVTYSVVVPVGALGGLRDTYVLINRGLVEGLRALGCPAQVVEEGRALPLEAGPCFQAPAPGEVTLGGRKLVGSAQVRMGRNVLQHGSVILSGDQTVLEALGGGADGSPPATLEASVGQLAWEEVADALAGGLALALGGGWRQGEMDLPEQRRARELEARRYATPEWTWRR